MNNQEKPEQQASAAGTPPPFCPSEKPLEAQEQASSPTLADRIAALGLNEEMTQRLTQLTAGLASDSASDDLLDTLARGICHDEDVNNADAAGYLRGRNEKIDAVMRPEPQEDDESRATPVFPQYCRHSIWD